MPLVASRNGRRRTTASNGGGGPCRASARRACSGRARSPDRWRTRADRDVALVGGRARAGAKLGDRMLAVGVDTAAEVVAVLERVGVARGDPAGRPRSRPNETTWARRPEPPRRSRRSSRRRRRAGRPRAARAAARRARRAGSPPRSRRAGRRACSLRRRSSRRTRPRRGSAARQLPGERRHPAAAVRDLRRARVVAGLRSSRFGPTWPLDFRRGERVARAAAGRREHLRARGRRRIGGNRRALGGRGGRVLAVEPDRARLPDADQHREERAAGQRQHEPREAVQAHDRHLRGEGAVDRAPEQGVREHAGRRALEAELEDAVVGDGQREARRRAGPTSGAPG